MVCQSLYLRPSDPTGPGYKWDNLAFANNAKWGEALKSLGKGDMEASRIDDSRRMPEVCPDGSVRKYIE